MANFNENKWIEFIKKLEWEELIHYNLFIWIAYQELWRLGQAEVFFDNYLSLVNPESISNFLSDEWLSKIEKADDRTKCFTIMCIEIEGLGLKYRTS